MLQGTVRQIKITPKFILHQNAKFSTRQYFRLYGNTDDGLMCDSEIAILDQFL